MMRAALLTCLCAVTSTVMAEPTAVYDQATISASGQHSQGALSVNQAAGELQQQNNVRVIQQHGASALIAPVTHVQQVNQNTLGNAPRQARAQINASFTHSQGVLGVNQSAGAANQQSNLFVLQCAENALNDHELAGISTVSQVNQTTTPNDGNYSVAIDEQSFAQSRGVVQLNQSAGIGNRSANAIRLRVLEGP